jgi:hypothetical protein
MKMITKLYSVYDSVANYFDKPIPARAVGEILRSAKTIANDPNHPIGQNPQDYFLYEIGTYDDSNACIEQTEPTRIACFNEFRTVDDPATLEN